MRGRATSAFTALACAMCLALTGVGTVIDAWSDGPDAGQDAGNPQWDHSHDWQTYEGVYTATTSETNYAWTNVNETGGGVVIDDLSFEVSWPLTYDLNAGAGVIPNKEQ